MSACPGQTASNSSASSVVERSRFRSSSFPVTPMCRWRWPGSSRERKTLSKNRWMMPNSLQRFRAFARTFERQHLQKSQEVLGRNFARLTPRQVEIFDLVAGGFTSHAIAAKLGISVRTVESYRAEIMEKMQAESVAVLVRQAICLGRINP